MDEDDFNLTIARAKMSNHVTTHFWGLHTDSVTFPTGTWGFRHDGFDDIPPDGTFISSTPYSMYKRTCCEHCGNTSGYRDSRGNCVGCGAPL